MVNHNSSSFIQFCKLSKQYEFLEIWMINFPLCKAHEVTNIWQNKNILRSHRFHFLLALNYQGQCKKGLITNWLRIKEPVNLCFQRIQFLCNLTGPLCNWSSLCHLLFSHTISLMVKMSLFALLLFHK